MAYPEEYYYKNKYSFLDVIKCLFGKHKWIDCFDTGSFYEECEPYCDICGCKGKKDTVYRKIK